MRSVCRTTIGLAAFVLLGVFHQPEWGGALLLIGLILAVVSYIGSCALSPSWLHTLDPPSVHRLRWFELAEALVILGLGVDFMKLWSIGSRLWGDSTITRPEPVIVGLLSVVGGEIFLTRWFAASLVGRDCLLSEPRSAGVLATLFQHAT